VVASAHRLPTYSTSARRDVLLSAIGRLLLPALDFGTVYLLTSVITSLTTFRQKLKTHLFRQAYPDIVLYFYFVHTRPYSATLAY